MSQYSSASGLLVTDVGTVQVKGLTAFVTDKTRCETMLFYKGRTIRLSTVLTVETLRDLTGYLEDRVIEDKRRTLMRLQRSLFLIPRSVRGSFYSLALQGEIDQLIDDLKVLTKVASV